MMCEVIQKNEQKLFQSKLKKRYYGQKQHHVYMVIQDTRIRPIWLMPTLLSEFMVGIETAKIDGIIFLKDLRN